MVQLDGSSIHQGVAYSVADIGNGKWRWKLHREITVTGELVPIISGEVSGTHDAAVAAAKAAIDARAD
jgi:hypothetical protein